MFNGTLKIRFFIDIGWTCFKHLNKNLHCSISLINSDNLLIFEYRNSKQNAPRKNHLGGQILYSSFDPSKKRRHCYIY